ncbi:acyl carrier protein [Lacticaseibacillus sp. GG6-2]
MTEQEVFAKISGLIQDHFQTPEDQITNDLNFKKDLDADSIDIVEFVLELEDTFGAEIPDEDAENIVTVGDAVSYVMAHQTK